MGPESLRARATRRQRATAALEVLIAVRRAERPPAAQGPVQSRGHHRDEGRGAAAGLGEDAVRR